jgi:hypothetical protein
MVERKVHELGYFDNESDASNAFDVAEVKLRGTPRLLTSAHRGVSWAARPKRWRAQIRSNGVNKHIGYFKDEKSAHEAYVAARTKRDLAASQPIVDPQNTTSAVSPVWTMIITQPNQT